MPLFQKQDKYLELSGENQQKFQDSQLIIKKFSKIELTKYAYLFKKIWSFEKMKTYIFNRKKNQKL